MEFTPLMARQLSSLASIVGFIEGQLTVDEETAKRFTASIDQAKQAREIVESMTESFSEES